MEKVGVPTSSRWPELRSFITGNQGYSVVLLTQKACTIFYKIFQKSFSCLFMPQDRNCPDQKKGDEVFSSSM
jgi:hypothetical protein